jgi:hypothetical protein
MPIKNLVLEVFLFITFQGTFTSFFKDKKSKGSHEIAKIKVFLTFDGKIRIRETQKPVRILRIRIRIPAYYLPKVHIMCSILFKITSYLEVKKHYKVCFNHFGR